MKKLKITYFIDPMSIWSYALELPLRKVKYLGKEDIEFENSFGLLVSNLNHVLGEDDDSEQNFLEFKSQILTQCKSALERTAMPFNLKHMENLKKEDLDSTELGIAYHSIKLIDEDISNKFLRILLEDIHTYNLDLNDNNVILDIVSSLNIDIEEYNKNITLGLAREKLLEDIEKANNEDIFSFPSLFMECGGRVKLLTGYVDYLRLELEIENLTKANIQLEEKEFNLENLKEFVSLFNKVAKAEIKLAFSASDDELETLVNELIKEDNFEKEEVSSSYFVKCIN